MTKTDVKLTAGAGFCLGLLLAALFTPPAQAQLLQGAIDGRVVDSTEAAIIGANVAITNEATNATRETVTNESGAYSFPTVNTGSYTLTVNAPGFQTHTETGVIVTINNVTRINVELEVGAVTETITVESAAATLQTDRAEVRQELTEKTFKDVPVPLGRNYQMMFITLPGFSPPENAHSVPTNPTRAVRFSVNGTSRSNNNTRIDGASSTNIWVPHMTGYNPALESIETVNVVTNSFDAEQGLAGGAAINLQIKSGTNDIHGSAFEYHTDQHIKAYPWNSDRTTAKPKFIYNQFGATIGGPIKQNKLFYFLSYEGTRESQFAQRFVDVPSPLMKTGDLSEVFNSSECSMTFGAGDNCQIYDPLTGDIDGVGRQPFPNNVIPQSRIDEGVQKIVTASQYPNPNIAGTGEFGLNRNFLAGGSTTFFRDTVDSKVNWNVNDKLSAFVRFSFLDYRMTNDQVFGDFGGNRLHPTNSNPGTGFGNTYSGTVSATYVVSPTFVIDGYFGYTLVDTNVEQDNLDQNVGWEFLGIPGLQSDRRIDGGWPRIRIDGFERLGISNNFMPYFRSDPQWQYVVNGNLTKGSHNIRFGADFYLQNLNHNQPEFSGSVGPASGGFRFRRNTTRLRGSGDIETSRSTDFNSFGSFLLGLPREAGKIWQFNEDGYFTRTRFFSMYLRDRWQITPKLTMSYGLRYEIFPFPTRETRGLERYDFDNNTIWACGVGSIPKDCGIGIGKHKVVPRLGFAYRATDNFVIRAGYGITNDPFNWARPLRTNYPIMLVQNLNAPNSFSFGTTLREGLPVITEPDLGDGVLDAPLTAAVRTMDTNNLTRGYIQSWNLTLERRFGGWIGQAGYVATRSTNQLVNLEQNWGPPGAGNAGRLLFQKFGRSVSTDLFGSVGTPKYDALQTKLQRRFRGDYQVQMAYTWAHGRGFTDEDSGDGVPTFALPWMYGRAYGRLNQDIRHNFQVTGIYELPFGRGKRWLQDGAAAAILGGWQVNNLLSWYSGRPFTVGGPSTHEAAGSGNVAQCISEPVKLGNKDAINPFYDPAAFAEAPEGQFGNCGRNNLSAPGLFNLDFSVFRKFQVGERVDIQFRAEMFNLTNTPHFREPRDDVDAGNFMLVDRIRNTGREGLDERFFRFGIRIGW